MMNQVFLFGPALGLLVGQTVDTATPAQPEVASISPSPRVVQADVKLGQDERCLLNPPLLLAGREAIRIAPGVGYDLKELAASEGRVRLVAFGPGAFFEDGRALDEIVTISIDELSLVSGQVNSVTGQAWQLFDRVGSGSKTRLIPKSLQFSLCRHYTGALASAPGQRRGRFGALRGSKNLPGGNNISAALSAAASSVLDIFGLGVGSFVRIRLTSDPSGAEVYLGGARQPPKTNTVMDVVGAELSQLSLQKAGYKPCFFSEWKRSFEAQNRRILNASCKLVPNTRSR